MLSNQRKQSKSKSKTKICKETRSNGEMRNTPIAAVSRNATGRQDNPGTTTEVDTAIAQAVDPMRHWMLQLQMVILLSLQESTLVNYIDQQDRVDSCCYHQIRSELYFLTVRDDEVMYATKQMLIYLCLFRVFLLCYKQQ
jgi:hypothetical protein